MTRINYDRTSQATLLVATLLLVVTALASSALNAAGLMTPRNQHTPLSIRDHAVHVVVEDGYVVTEVEQVFSNNSAQDFEAIYTFPVPQHGLVGEFTYWIDGKPVTGEVVRKHKAREIYEQEKAHGRETAIAEKDGYRDFEISVYPVRAGKDVRTRLVYLQTASTDTGIGRYVYPLEEGDVDEQRDAFWDVRDAVTGTFRFTMDLKSSYPIDAVRLPRQTDAKTTQIGPGHWRIESTSAGSVDNDHIGPAEPAWVASIGTDRQFDIQVSLLELASGAVNAAGKEALRTLAGQIDANTGNVFQGITGLLPDLLPGSADAGNWPMPQDAPYRRSDEAALQALQAAAHLNADIVVYWRHQDGLPGSVDLVTWKPDAAASGTFMLTLTPGDDLPAIAEGRDWVFVLDNSGSMSGKYATLADGVEQALNQLRPEDRFRIITFNNSAREITPGFVAATRSGMKAFADRVRQLGSSGGTNLYEGIERGLQSLDADRSSGVILVTDGVANVGVTEKKAFLELIRRKDVRLYTMIMGNSANRPLLQEMTDVSDGFAMSVSTNDDITGVLRLATSKLTHAAMHNVKIEIDGAGVFDLQPDVIGTVYRGEQLVLMGHYRNGGDTEVRLTAEVAGTPVQYRARFDFPQQGGDNPELERLWAYRTIEHMQSKLDYYGADADLQEGITNLALGYGLVTDYTSMLIVREEMFEALGISRTNRDRVALERQLRDQRKQSGPASRRVDQQQPMFRNARPPAGGSGGGAFSPVGLLLLISLFAMRLRRRQR